MKYKKMPLLPNGEEQKIIYNTEQKLYIPMDTNNTYYQEYLTWLAEGNEPESPDFIPADVQLRNQRDSILQQTDIPWSLADYEHPNKQAWLTYRQALRDLPATVDPQLDDVGNLTNITWPIKPEPADEPEE